MLRIYDSIKGTPQTVYLKLGNQFKIYSIVYIYKSNVDDVMFKHPNFSGHHQTNSKIQSKSKSTAIIRRWHMPAVSYKFEFSVQTVLVQIGTFPGNIWYSSLNGFLPANVALLKHPDSSFNALSFKV